LCCLADCAEVLLAAGSSPNEVNLKKLTPLHVASQFGLLELRSCLCGWGARIERGLKPAVINLVPPKTCKVQIKIGENDPYDDGLVLE
jgi:ankyrin repeat protein